MKKKESQNILEMLALVGQIAITMLVPIVGCTFFGYLVGKYFNAVWITIIFFFIGSLSGFLSIYKLVKKYIK